MRIASGYPGCWLWLAATGLCLASPLSMATEQEASRPESIRPEVTIDPGGVGPEVLQAIMGSVDVIVRLAEDMDGGESTRLRRRAYEAALSALATQGYFEPVVTLEVGTDFAGETWDFVIEPGKRAVVRKVDLEFTGAASRPEFAERRETWRQGWQLPAGDIFINKAWSQAKADLLSQVGEQDFFLARMAHSQARVDPEAGAVDVSVTIDSGPRVLLGELKVEGLRRTPEELIDYYVRYKPGQPYERDQFVTWQQQLQSTNFFRGAFVYPEQPTAEDDVVVKSDGDLTLPVQVQVTEAAARRYAFSLGLDSDVGVRAEAQYRQNIVFGLPLTMETGIGLDRKRQRAYLDFYLPPDANGYKDSIGLLADRSDINGLDVTRLALGATRFIGWRSETNRRVDYEARYGALLAHDRVRLEDGEPYSLPSASLTAEWLRRDVNDKYDPRDGNLIVLGTGGGMTLDDGKPYLRGSLRVQTWWPLSKRDILSLHAEVGKVWANDQVQVPDDFGYRTGGARSIRGYKYRSIGEHRDGAVIGARTLALAGIEYTHYFNDTVGMAVFVDAGDAAASFKDMKVFTGYGAGARVRTPAGPLELDLAWGQRDHRLRLHFSLGIAF